MHTLLIVFSLVIAAALIAFILNHFLARNLHDWFTVADAVKLPGGIQVQICTVNDPDLYRPEAIAWRARRAGYRLATQLESKIPYAALAQAHKDQDLYFIIDCGPGNRPRMSLSIKKTGFTTEEELKAPRYVLLVKHESIHAGTTKQEPIAA